MGRVRGLGRVGLFGPGVRLDWTRVSLPGRICVFLSEMGTEALIAVAVGLAQTGGWVPTPWSGAFLTIAAIDITASSTGSLVQHPYHRYRRRWCAVFMAALAHRLLTRSTAVRWA